MDRSSRASLRSATRTSSRLASIEPSFRKSEPAGNTHGSCIEAMTLETLTTVTLLTKLLLALRANDPKGFRRLLEMGLDELGIGRGQ